MSKPTEKLTYTGNTSYNFATKNNPRKREYLEQGIMSIALAKTIAQPKEPTLFDNIEASQELSKMRAVDKTLFIDRANKPVTLTQTQHKIIYALALFLSQYREEKEFMEYVEKVNNHQKIRLGYGFPISITELTKLISTEGKARARDKERVIKELRLLSEIYQAQAIQAPNAQGVVGRLIAPLIILKERIEDLTPNKEANLDYVTVEFGRAFFYEIYKRYTVIKPQLFDIWGKAGSGATTELFDILLFDLVEKQGGHKVAANVATSKIKRKNYNSEEEYEQAVKKAQTSALTYSLLATTIRSKVTRDYESKRSYRAAFKKDLQGAIQAFITLGLITQANFVTTPNGERIDFVFNYYYNNIETKGSIAIAQRELEALPD